ncbi:hypothetical protein [Streptomyces sp. NPDC001307]|uniref:hypothetical protein n=1 Tax=Streptomyces sp. NPDC001307 TaxID=3364560 RepID=UPI0036C635B7
MIVGATLATAAMATLSGNANAVDAATLQQQRREAFEHHLAAEELAPVTPDEAVTYSETKAFIAAAHDNNESDGAINSLLTSGKWVGYPVSVKVVDGHDDTADTAFTVPLTAVDDTKADAASDTSTADALAGDSSAVSPNWTPPTICETPWRTEYMQNIYHANLWSFQLKQHFCYQNGNIVSFDNPPVVNHWVSTLGSAAGWDWKGLDSSGTAGPSRYSWGGKSHGGLKTWRKGSFRFDPILPIAAASRYPWVHIYAHGNGSSDRSSGISW